MLNKNGRTYYFCLWFEHLFIENKNILVKWTIIIPGQPAPKVKQLKNM